MSRPRHPAYAITLSAFVPFPPHAVCERFDCDFSRSSSMTTIRESQEHVRSTGHTVAVEQVHSMKITAKNVVVSEVSPTPTTIALYDAVGPMTALYSKTDVTQPIPEVEP